MNLSDNNNLEDTGILPICSVKDCINFIERKDGGIIRECCKFEHYEALRPCKHYKKLSDNQNKEKQKTCT